MFIILYLNNSLMSTTESHRIVFIYKIIQLNESLKTCKKILDDKLLHMLNILKFKIDNVYSIIKFNLLFKI